MSCARNRLKIDEYLNLSKKSMKNILDFGHVWVGRVAQHDIFFHCLMILKMVLLLSGCDQ